MRRAARTVALAVLLAACGTATAGQPQYVDLSQRVALPAEGTGDVLPLRIAVAAILSPEGTVESYSALAGVRLTNRGAGAGRGAAVHLVPSGGWHSTAPGRRGRVGGRPVA